MTTFAKKFELIELNDIEALITNKVKEGGSIEYKSQMIRPEQLCAAVSSFANAFGGDFYLGIEEAEGDPTTTPGIEEDDIDACILRISHILQNGLEPRLARYDIKPFEVSPKHYVILIRAYRSWSRPHRVKQNNQFYSRKSNGKFPLDVHELREMFLGTTEFSKRYELFKEERLLSTFNEYGNVPFFIAHLLPLSCFENQYSLDVNLINQVNMTPLGTAGSNPRINIHGLYSESCDSEFNNTESRMQIFRNGIIELSTVRMMEYSTIIPYTIERQLIQAVKRQIYNYNVLEINEPFYFICSFYGVQDIGFLLGPEWSSLATWPLTEEKIILPDVLIDPKNLVTRSYEEIGLAIKPALDGLWNAFGLAEAHLNFK
ncbi:Putative DNA-binding domain-containing protein [Paenibacillus sp. OK060]|uniref:AlbA family DNA-binding domain-containing protein n=1 Tax=Paenibacillus sp. OK060 TaxID=1881034 RepID=UPI000886EEEB|nr:ATP-binding protein [Paenibacillus sp. OK060]SDM17140.1 Putative DNA-binding domain-containing protein [Paenibacillus sp. OK060]